MFKKKSYRKLEVERIYRHAIGNYESSSVSQSSTPKVWHKNGELMNAVSGNTYFAILLTLVVGPFSLGFVSAINLGQPILLSIIGVSVAGIWAGVEFVLLLYFNRNVSGGFD